MALILGVPTAISYDVVRAGDKYGAVFELLNARSFSKILAEQPEKMDWCVQEYIDLLKRIHSIEVSEGKLPSYNPTVQGWIRRARSFLPPEQGQRLQDMIEAIPDRGTMIHGDYHTKNIVLSGEEVLLVDMDTLSTGHPIFELAQMYCSFIGFYETEQRQIMDYQGFDADTGRTFWRKSLRAYLETEDEEAIARAENIIRCVAYVKLIDWSIRHYQPDDEDGLHEREYWRQELTELLDRSNAAHPEADIRVWRIKKVRARTEEPLSVFVSILNSGRARKTDLHMHTSVSDGTDTPKEILAYVRDAGVPLFSITDHDSVEANRIIRSIQWEGEPHFITGAEFSCKDENGLYHILGYGFDPDAPSIKKLLEIGRAYWVRKTRTRLDHLQKKHDFSLSEERIRRLYSMDDHHKTHFSDPGEKHKGAPWEKHKGAPEEKHKGAPAKETPVSRYLNHIRILNDYLRPEEAIVGILAAGGIPVLAHPFLGSGEELITGEAVEQRLKTLMNYGLKGVEAFYPAFSEEQTRELIALAEKNGLYVTAGSDYQGKNKKAAAGCTGMDSYAEIPSGFRSFLKDVRYLR